MLFIEQREIEELLLRCAMQHMSPNMGGEKRWELFEGVNMAYRNPSKSSSQGKHLHGAHRQDDKHSSGHSRLLGDGTHTLVHRYTPVGVRREPVGGLHRYSSTISDTLVHRYTHVGVKNVS